MRSLVFAALAALLASCTFHDAAFDETHYRCDVAAPLCPEGQRCVAGRCEVASAAADAAAPDAAVPDATLPDAATDAPPPPITITNLTAFAATPNRTEYTTTTIAVSGGDLIVVDVFSGLVAAGTAQPPTAIEGAGLTFTRLAQVSAGSAQYNNLSRWYARAPAAASGPLTITYADLMEISVWSVNRVDGCRTTGPNGADAFVQTNTAYAADASSQAVSLGAFARADDATLAAFSNERPTAGTPYAASPGPGFVELSDRGGNADTVEDSLMVEWKASADRSPSVTWTGAGSSRGIATELARRP